MKKYQIELCTNYTTTGHPKFRPICTLGFRAGLWCHSYNSNHFCRKYEVESDIGL